MLVSSKEAGQRLGISAARVRQLAIAGRLPQAVKVGTGGRASWVFPLEGDARPVLLPGRPAGRPKQS